MHWICKDYIYYSTEYQWIEARTLGMLCVIMGIFWISASILKLYLESCSLHCNLSPVLLYPSVLPTPCLFTSSLLFLLFKVHNPRSRGLFVSYVKLTARWMPLKTSTSAITSISFCCASSLLKDQIMSMLWGLWKSNIKLACWTWTYFSMGCRVFSFEVLYYGLYFFYLYLVSTYQVLNWYLQWLLCPEYLGYLTCFTCTCSLFGKKESLVDTNSNPFQMFWKDPIALFFYPEFLAWAINE